MIRVKFWWRDAAGFDDLDEVAELSILPPIGDKYEDDDGFTYRIQRRIWSASPGADADVVCELVREWTREQAAKYAAPGPPRDDA